MKTALIFGQTKWIHYSSPSTEELQSLMKEYDFHELIEEDLLDTYVQPKIDQYDNDIFVVLTFPKYNQQTRKYIINEFNAVLGKDYIITISTYEANHIAKIVEQYKADLAESDIKDEEAYKVSPYYILYTTIDEMYNKTLKAQASAMKDIVMLENSVSSNDITQIPLHELMKKKANSTFLKYTFLPQKTILMEIQKACIGFYDGDLDVYFEDLESKLDKILTNSLIMIETLQSITETYDETINNQMNAIMRVLTLLTAITGVLSLLMSFYSMNIKVPLMSSDSAWWILLLIMFSLIILMVFIFKKKKWM